MKPLWQHCFIPTVLLLGGLLSIAFAHDLRSVQRLPDGTLGVLTGLGIFSTVLAIVWLALTFMIYFKGVVQKTFADLKQENVTKPTPPATTPNFPPSSERR